MKDTKLIKMLKTFSRDELGEFRKFASSPYHRKRDLLPLLDVLKRFHPSYDDARLTNEYVFAKMFPGRRYGDRSSDSLLKTMTSELFVMCKNFLVQMELKEKKNFENYFLLTQLRKRRMLSEFSRDSKTAEEFLEEDCGNNFELIEKSYLSSAFVEYYIDRHEFEKCYEMVIRQNEFLSASALISMLRFSSQQDAAEYGYNLKTRRNLVHSILRHLDVESLINELRQQRSRFDAYIEINYAGHLIYTSKTADRKLFVRMRDLLSKHKDKLTQQELYIFYSMVASYGNKIFSGAAETKYRDEVVKLYKIMLGLKAHKFSPDDHMQVGLFRSMLIAARVSGELEWMKKLIDDHLNELPPHYIDNMRSYALGQYYFGTGDYGKALENLVVLRSDYFLYKKDLKNLLFRIYYSLGYYEEAYATLENLRKYLSSTGELSERMITVSKNFVKFAGELLKVRHSGNTEEAMYLKKRILSHEETESADWIIEKLEEI